MNRQSNTYTVIYASVLVLVVGIVLSVVYQQLRPLQVDNINNDTKRQILLAARITAEPGQNISELYDQYITSSFIVNAEGDKVDSDVQAFDVNVSEQVKKPADERLLPVFECKTDNGVKYILPCYGAGLWGPIWGYVAFDNNGDTIYGAYFAHQGETPGLGAEIEKTAFQDQFQGKNVFGANGDFQSVAVSKVGQEPADRSYVHAISGGTITSQGVQKMLLNSLEAYSGFLKKLGGNTNDNN